MKSFCVKCWWNWHLEALFSPSAAITLARASREASASAAMARWSCSGSLASLLKTKIVKNSVQNFYIFVDLLIALVQKVQHQEVTSVASNLDYENIIKNSGSLPFTGSCTPQQKIRKLAYFCICVNGIFITKSNALFTRDIFAHNIAMLRYKIFWFQSIDFHWTTKVSS